MQRVVTWNLSENFIERVADHVVRHHAADPRDLSRLCFVFGGKRPALFLKRALARRIGHAFQSPAFLPVDEFMRRAAQQAVPSRPVSDTDAAWLLYRLAQTLAPGMLKNRTAFARFEPWAREIAALIDQLDREGVENNQLKNVEANAAIGYEVPENINALLASVSELRRAYHDELAKRGLMSAGLAFGVAAQSMAAQDPDYDTVFFCNLFYLHRTEAQAVKALHDRGKAVLFFQGDADEWPVLKNVERFLGITIKPESSRLPVPAIKLYAGFDTHSQAAIARSIIAGLDRPESAVLSVPDGAALLPVLAELKPVAGDFNVSLGYPLEHTSVYALINDIFAAQISRRGAAYYTRDYVRVLTHPLAKNSRFLKDPSVTRVIVHKVEEALTGQVKDSSLGGKTFVALGEVEADASVLAAADEMLLRMDAQRGAENVRTIIARLHGLLFKPWEEVGTLAAGAAAVRLFLDGLLKYSFLSSHALNERAAERLYAVADEMESSLAAAEPMPAEEVFEFMQNRMRSEMVSFPGSPLKGLQVLGMLESRNLAFDTVVIMDMNESAVPKLPSSEALIPREILTALGVKRLETEEEIQRYHFMSLVAPAREAHLIYAENDQKEKSRFIEEIIWKRQKAERQAVAFPVTRGRFGLGSPTRKRAFAKTGPMMEFLKNYRYSPSSVNTYLECPLQFFFRYVCGLSEKEELTDEPENAEIGTFMHAVLEEGFRQFVGRRPVIDRQFRDGFLARAHAAFNREIAPRMKTDAFLLEELVDLRLKRFLDAEEERQAAVNAVVALERKFDATMTLDGGIYSFRAVVDRVDEMADGSLLIIDYKTGGATVPRTAASLEKMLAALGRISIKNAVQSFQLPVYIDVVTRAFPGRSVDAVLYNLRRAEQAGIFSDKERADGVVRARKLELCRVALARIMSEITDPAVPFEADDSDRRRCGFCPYYYACR